MEVLDTISRNVKQYRESKAMTQQELADVAGLHRNYILSVEKGDRNLTVSTLDEHSSGFTREKRRIKRSLGISQV